MTNKARLRHKIEVLFNDILLAFYEYEVGVPNSLTLLLFHSYGLPSR